MTTENFSDDDMAKDVQVRLLRFKMDPETKTTKVI